MFLLTFWSYRRNGLIRMVNLISKLITSQPVNKQLQYTYCPISHKAKASRQ